MSSDNSKRIAKNTMMLYLRMIVTTIVSLFTARLTLQLLGVEDFGINNVVSGIVGFMSIITHVMNNATQRFLAYDLGKQDIKHYQQTFSMLINIFAIFSIVSVIILELVGPWIIAKYLVIPPNRLVAAQWVYQFTIFNFVCMLMITPYQGAIISYEKMGIYAYFTFIDVAFKLLNVLVLYITPFDKLISYGAVGVLMTFLYRAVILLYCKRKLEGCIYIKFWEKDLFKKMAGFAGWNLFGSVSWTLNNQGQTLLLNIFFGPVVNAAKAVADKINGLVVQLSNNFFMAVSPQIVKSYADGDLEYTKNLVLKSSKFSFLLLAVVSFPLIFNMDYLLKIWLGEEQVSHEMIKFCKLILVFAMVNSLEAPISQAFRAYGNIKKYQLYIGLQTLLFAPITYLLFKWGFDAYYSMITLIVVYAISQISRVIMVRKIISLSMVEYIKAVLLPICCVSVLTVCVLLIVNMNSSDFVSLLTNLCVSFLISAFIILIAGINKKERLFAYDVIKTKCRL